MSLSSPLINRSGGIGASMTSLTSLPVQFILEVGYMKFISPQTATQLALASAMFTLALFLLNMLTETKPSTTTAWDFVSIASLCISFLITCISFRNPSALARTLGLIYLLVAGVLCYLKIHEVLVENLISGRF